MINLKSELSGLGEDQVANILKKFATQISDKFKQEFIGENEEFLDRLLHQFQSKITRCAWKASQKWCRWNKDGPILMPDYTRIYYRKGKTEVLVQEFPPQIRLTKFRGRLGVGNHSGDNIPTETHSKVFRHSLAFPYCIFIFKFREGLFSEVRFAFSDRPLKRLDEKPMRPYMSNIDNGLKVCLGISFDHSKLEQGNIVQQAAFIISYFWQSVCTDEWSQNYWNNKQHFQDVGDKRMSTLKAWEKASIDNPLFVVEDVQWMPHGEESFGDMIVRMFDDDQVAAEMGQDLYNTFVDDFLQEVKRTLEENLTKAVNQTGSLTIDQIKQEFDKAMK
jgi:hypothetical protein